MTKGQQALYDFMNKHERFPTVEESIDMYAEHCLKSSARCIWTKRGKRVIDYKLWELKSRAYTWLRQSIGTLAMSGDLQVRLPGNKQSL